MFQVIKQVKLKANYLRPKIFLNQTMHSAFSKLEPVYQDEKIIPKLAQDQHLQIVNDKKEEMDAINQYLKEKQQKELNAKIHEFSKRLLRGIEVICQRNGSEKDEIFSIGVPTKNLFMIHFGIGGKTDYETIKEFIISSSGPHKLTVFPGLSYGYAQFDSVEAAEQVISKCDTLEAIEDCFYKELHYDKKVRVTFFLYAKCELKDFTNSKNKEISDASLKAEVPGLFFQEEFITKEMEELLMKQIDVKEWNRYQKRNGQHFGYEFLYGINTIDKNKKIDPIPSFLSELMEKMNNVIIKGEQPELDQLTINNINPGDGIAPHFDMHSSFEEKIIIISLNSGLVLSFKSQKNEQKHLFLPPRSILVLEGEARYAWYHNIACRKMDKVNGDIIFRKRYVSLTFRTVKKTPCTCPYPFFCEDQGFDILSIKKDNNSSSKDYDSRKVVAPKDKEEKLLIENAQAQEQTNKPTILEKKYVNEVYDKIALHFSKTRYSPWPKIANFLKSIEPGSLVADIGCGNGKYLDCHNGDIFLNGTDRCENLVSLAREKGENIQVFSADSLNLPWKPNRFDYAISIAVIHHFSTPQLRIHAIQEILRILKDKGQALIYVWAFEQNQISFTEQDAFVPWNLQNKYEIEGGSEGEETTEVKKNEEINTLVYKRYYHVFKKGELEDLISHIPNCKIVDSYYDHANWVVQISKESSL